MRLLINRVIFQTESIRLVDLNISKIIFLVCDKFYSARLYYLNYYINFSDVCCKLRINNFHLSSPLITLLRNSMYCTYYKQRTVFLSIVIKIKITNKSFSFIANPNNSFRRSH